MRTFNNYLASIMISIMMMPILASAQSYIRPAFKDIDPNALKEVGVAGNTRGDLPFGKDWDMFKIDKPSDRQGIWPIYSMLRGIANSIAIDKIPMAKRKAPDSAGGCLQYGPSLLKNTCDLPISVAYCQKFSDSSKYGQCDKGHLSTMILPPLNEISLHTYTGVQGVPTEVMGCTLPALPVNLSYDPKMGKASGQCGIPANLMDAFSQAAIERGRWSSK